MSSHSRLRVPSVSQSVQSVSLWIVVLRFCSVSKFSHVPLWSLYSPHLSCVSCFILIVFVLCAAYLVLLVSLCLISPGCVSLLFPIPSCIWAVCFLLSVVASYLLVYCESLRVSGFPVIWSVFLWAYAMKDVPPATIKLPFSVYFLWMSVCIWVHFPPATGIHNP